MAEYTYHNIYSYKPCGVMATDLYNVLRGEIAVFVTEIYHQKMQALTEKYDDYDFNMFEQEVSMFSRISNILLDDDIDNLNDYASYYLRNFNTSLFSRSYVIETESSMRIIRKIDSLINRLKLDIMAKIPDFPTRVDNDPYLAITYHFDGDYYRTWNTFQDFLNDCVDCILDRSI